MLNGPVVLFVVLFVVIGGMVVTALGFGPVPRARVERFAARGTLPITLGNGNLVIRYLGVTRRWRALGLLIGFAASITWSQHDGSGQINVNLLVGFAGWFVGAVIAEYEFSVGQPRQQHAASLQPRLLRDRLSFPAQVWPLAIVGVGLGCAAVLLVTQFLHGRTEMWPVVGYLALIAAAIGVPALVGRHVLNRAQPLNLSPDLLDADNALRHRSLHVLAGCAVALACYPAGGLAGLAGARLNESDQPLSQSPVSLAFFILAFALIFMPIIGWLVARTRRTPELAGMTLAR